MVGIEPASMTAVFCQNAKDRSAETWKQQLEPFSGLEFAVADAAKGIASAVSQLAKAREIDPSALALAQGLDLFHTTMEATRVLAQYWRRAEAAWELAEAADAKVADAKQQGLDARRGRGRAERMGQGDGEVRANRASGIGLGPCPRGVRPIHPRRPAQRPHPSRCRDHCGGWRFDRP